MANYALTDWVSAVSDPITVAAAIETYLETVDDTKSIIVSQIIPIGSSQCQAIIVHEA